jgi:uncharacterized SAM-binding protein YcdF (DUF218 family)
MRRLWRALRTLLILIGVAVIVLTVTPINYWYATWLAGDWSDSKGEILIVLGGGMEQGGFPNAATLRRSLYAVRAWREGGFRKIVVSGGPDQVSKVMREYMIFSGVPETAVIEEPESKSTRENALFVSRILHSEPGRKVLLTSDYQMFRAHRAFIKAGLEIAPRPIPDVRQRHYVLEQRWALAIDLAKETAKIIYYKARGWI